MKIHIGLSWAKGTLSRRLFKEEAYFKLFSQYVGRISNYASCAASGFDLSVIKKSPAKVWLCHSSKNSKELSSEELAQAIQKLENSGTKELLLLIGPSDGFTKEAIAALAPDFLWSFGPMTLPHELASVVAAEQVYRAYTILNRHPYHSGH